ncbi:MAG: hypothetical protein GXW85_04755 [Clostridia bacterium]|nr:hypothetical protein [Clostridia bacterium]
MKELEEMNFSDSFKSLIRERRLDDICNSICQVLKENELTYQQAIEIFEYLKVKLKYVAKIT